MGSYDSFCRINLVEREANGTPRDTIFIYDPFHEASYRENSNEITYLLTFMQDYCDLMSQPFVKVHFVMVDVPQAPAKALTGHYAIIFSSVYSEVSSSKTINLGLPAQKR